MSSNKKRTTVSYKKGFDLHAAGVHNFNPQSLAIVACEHGFRSVACRGHMIGDVVSEINKIQPNALQRPCVIGIVDELGISSEETRVCAIIDAASNKAQCVQITVPYYAKDVNNVIQDIKSCYSVCFEYQVDLHYTIPNKYFESDVDRKILCMALKTNNIDICIINTNGFIPSEFDVSDDVIYLQEYVLWSDNHIKCKCFIDNPDKTELLKAIKNNMSYVGVPYERATDGMYEIQEMIHEEIRNRLSL